MRLKRINTSTVVIFPKNLEIPIGRRFTGFSGFGLAPATLICAPPNILVDSIIFFLFFNLGPNFTDSFLKTIESNRLLPLVG